MCYNFKQYKFNIYSAFVKDILYKIQISNTNFPPNRVALQFKSPNYTGYFVYKPPTEF